MDLYTQIAQKIIEAQEQVIGPVAISQAQDVQWLTVNWEDGHAVTVDRQHATESIDELVAQYEDLFGPIARETSKEVTLRYVAQLPPDQIPKSLL